MGCCDGGVPHEGQGRPLPASTGPTWGGRDAHAEPDAHKRRTASAEAPPARPRIWGEPRISGLELLRASLGKHHFPPHFHEGFGIYLQTHGTCRFRCGNRSYEVTPGEIALSNPGEVNEAHTRHGPWSFRSFHLKPQLLRQAVAGTGVSGGCSPWFTRAHVRDPELAGSLLQLHELLDAGGDPLATESLLTNCLLRVLTHYGELSGSEPPPGTTGNGPVRRAREFIHESYDREISLKSIARAANLSRDHLLRLFRREIGLSPYRYLLQVRVQHARQLITRGVPLSDVALAVGFCDQSHLTNHFKRFVGVTPGLFARTFRTSASS